MKKFILSICLALLISMPALAQERGTVDEAKAMVVAANDYIAANGLEAAIKEFNNPTGQFKTKDLYIFAWNFKTGTMEAHGANQAMVGKPFMDMKDADGVFFFHDFKKIAEEAGEGSTDYKWPNPVTKKVEAKTTFIKKVSDDLLIGCGAYK